MAPKSKGISFKIIVSNFVTIRLKIKEPFLKERRPLTITAAAATTATMTTTRFIEWIDWGPVPGPKIPSNLLDLGRTTWSFFLSFDWATYLFCFAFSNFLVAVNI